MRWLEGFCVSLEGFCVSFAQPSMQEKTIRLLAASCGFLRLLAASCLDGMRVAGSIHWYLLHHVAWCDMLMGFQWFSYVFIHLSAQFLVRVGAASGTCDLLMHLLEALRPCGIFCLQEALPILMKACGRATPTLTRIARLEDGVTAESARHEKTTVTISQPISTITIS